MGKNPGVLWSEYRAHNTSDGVDLDFMVGYVCVSVIYLYINLLSNNTGYKDHSGKESSGIIDGKWDLTVSHTSPGFTCLQYKSFENAVGKGEIARNEQFLLFPQCFLLMWRTVCHFHRI